MKNIFTILGVILLVILGFYIGNKYSQNITPPAWDDIALKKVNKFVTLELTRKWSKTIKDDVGPGVGIIEYSWEFTYLFGFDIPKDWDWKAKKEEGVLKITIPKLKQLNPPKFQISKLKEFNQANGNRQQRMLKKITDIGIKSIKNGAKSLLKKDSYVVDMAKESFASNIIDIVNLANPENLIYKVEISIED